MTDVVYKGAVQFESFKLIKINAFEEGVQEGLLDSIPAEPFILINLRALAKKIFKFLTYV